MTGSDFYTYVLNSFKRTDKSTEVYEAVTDAVMEMRLRLLSEDHKAVSTELSGISSVGDYTLTLPSDFGHLIGDVIVYDSVAGDEYPPLKKITKTKWDELYTDALTSDQDTGVPEHYAFLGNSIYLGPVPDSTDYKYRLNYTTEDQAAITSGTSDVPFTDKYRWILRAGTLKHLYNILEAYEEAQAQEIIFERGLATIADSEDFSSDAGFNVEYTGV